jgi:recombination protein RecR
MLPDRLMRVVQLFAKLPGVGEKTAQRYAISLLSADESVARDLGHALAEMHDHVRPCSRCGNIADVRGPGEPVVCVVCRDSRRDASLLCVVARVQDLFAIERSGAMRGRYHVLGRLLSPLDGIGREQIGMDRLVERVVADSVREVLVATPPSVDGEATALLISRELGAQGVQVSRIASGVPHGGDLEFADQITLGRAIEHRRRFTF